MSTKINLTWDETIKDTRTLINLIQDYIENKKISKKRIELLIPCRGGEIIGSLLKNKLKLTESQVTRIKFSNKKYETGEEKIEVFEEDKANYEILKNKLLLEDKILIFVDDLVDSGLTLDFIQAEMPNNRNLIKGVLYSKVGKNKEKVDFCIKDLKDQWIVFPWEQIYEN